MAAELSKKEENDLLAGELHQTIRPSDPTLVMKRPTNLNILPHRPSIFSTSSAASYSDQAVAKYWKVSILIFLVFIFLIILYTISIIIFDPFFT